MCEADIVEDMLVQLHARGYHTQVGWECIPGCMQYGEGDILATKDTTVLAIECKYINRKKRTQKRKKVKDQAMLYACYAKLKYPNSTVYGIWATNEGRGQIGKVAVRQAMQHVRAFLVNKHPVICRAAVEPLQQMFDIRHTL